jgi:anti-anti-sigma factor
MSLKILVRQSSTPTIELNGRLDTSTAPDLDKVLDRVLANKGTHRLVFEASGLDYLSSAGVRCFIRARKALEPGGGSVSILNPQPPVRKVLDIIKAIPSGSIFSSVAELDAYLDEMQRRVRDGE